MKTSKEIEEFKKYLDDCDDLNPAYADVRAKHDAMLMMHWGFEVGPGWHDLIAQLLDDISKEKLNKKFAITQIKEKLGALRVYTRHGKESVYKLIEEAEKKSVTICEKCGADGKLHNDGGWYVTRCDPCLNK